MFASDFPNHALGAFEGARLSRPSVTRYMLADAPPRGSEVRLTVDRAVAELDSHPFGRICELSRPTFVAARRHYATCDRERLSVDHRRNFGRDNGLAMGFGRVR